MGGLRGKGKTYDLAGKNEVPRGGGGGLSGGGKGKICSPAFWKKKKKLGVILSSDRGERTKTRPDRLRWIWDTKKKNFACGSALGKGKGEKGGEAVVSNACSERTATTFGGGKKKVFCGACVGGRDEGRVKGLLGAKEKKKKREKEEDYFSAAIERGEGGLFFRIFWGKGVLDVPGEKREEETTFAGLIGGRDPYLLGGGKKGRSHLRSVCGERMEKGGGNFLQLVR